MTSTPTSAATAATVTRWTPSWSPDHTDSSLPPITVINDPHDLPDYTITALASHHPATGRVAVHPTPLATAPAYLAHDLIRALGKHLPPPHREAPWWTLNAESSWRVTLAWTQALHIDHYVICRAHRITERHLEYLMALRERTRTRLTLVISGPPPAALATVLSAVRHHEIDSLEAARQHLNTGAQSRSHASNYPGWHHAAPFPAPDDEPWYALPPRSRRPGRRPATTTPTSRSTVNLLPGRATVPPPVVLPALTDLAAPSPHHEAVAQRIHTRIAHPVHAAAVAVRALTGYGIDQLARLTRPTPQRPQADLPADLPRWAELLLEAAHVHSELENYTRPGLPAHLTDANKPFRLTRGEEKEIAHATETCRLIAANPAPERPSTRRKNP
ncbi:hypothetical protein ACFT1B_18500 [Streptomyces griseoincarnatus]|uniref:Uncharacterized protein n=1 Tax=Streptomyces ardesiacus TaxID=285564 RepID=A0ABW8HJT9_9ACTN